MSQLTSVLESGAAAAEVAHGLWRVVVWEDPGAPGGRWRGRVYQPQTADEDLAMEARFEEPDLSGLVRRLVGYPYFVSPDLPWRPGGIPRDAQL
jgi:hypothetical protein